MTEAHASSDKSVNNKDAPRVICTCDWPGGDECPRHPAEKDALAEAWEAGHLLGEALAYNAVGDILWERHRDVINRSQYAAYRAAHVESMPHWDTNPYRVTPPGVRA